MPTSKTDLTNPPRRLPHIRLPSLTGGTDIPIIWRRTGPILLLLHPDRCETCSAFAHRVAAVSDGITEWDGRPLVIVSETTGIVRSDSMLTDLPFPILDDREGRLRTALRMDAPAVIIADQWGEIYERIEAGDGHRFPEPDELVDWARVIATKCPECEGEVF
jgi:hypothetical protein